MPIVRVAERVEEVTACFDLMRQLRPHLCDRAEFVERWQRQQGHSYRLLVAWEGDMPVALAGYRTQENLLQGLHLYVDDLVTSESARGGGHGALLLNWLKAEGARQGMHRLVLDAAIGNALGHRFYFRNGFLARGLHFWADLDSD